jgi:hypothetical protein
VSGQEDLRADVISMLLKLPEDLTEDFTVAEREKTRNVLKEKNLWFELVEKPKIVFEKLVPLVAKKPFGGVD